MGPEDLLGVWDLGIYLGENIQKVILHLNLTRNVDQNQDPSMTIIKIFIRLELRR